MRLLEAANEKVRSVASELKRLNEEKSTFLGIAAHDLRNPLGVVLGYAEMLRDEEFSRKETADMAARSSPPPSGSATSSRASSR